MQAGDEAAEAVLAVEAAVDRAAGLGDAVGEHDQAVTGSQGMNRPGNDVIPLQNHLGGGPGSPAEPGGTGWRDTLQRTGERFVRARCSMTAGNLAFHWFVALFPALIALLGLVSLAHAGAAAVHRLVNGLVTALPAGASGVFTQAVHSATTRSSASSLTALIIGIVVAVWSASSVYRFKTHRMVSGLGFHDVGYAHAVPKLAHCL